MRERKNCEEKNFDVTATRSVFSLDLKSNLGSSLALDRTALSFLRQDNNAHVFNAENIEGERARSAPRVFFHLLVSACCRKKG